MADFIKSPPHLMVRKVAEDAAQTLISGLPKAWPASIVSMNGQIATVQIELLSEVPLPQLTVPIATSRYDNIPLQGGQYGLLVPSDFHIGNIAGLDEFRATVYATEGDLGALVFVPISFMSEQEKKTVSSANDTQNTKPQPWPRYKAGQRVVTGDKDGVLIINQAGGHVSVTMTDKEAVINCGGDKKAAISFTEDKITVTVGDGNMEVNEDHVSMMGGQCIVTKDDVTIKKLHVTGETSIDGSLSVGGSAKVSGSVEGSSVRAGGISLSTHKHSNGNEGSPTGPPIP